MACGELVTKIEVCAKLTGQKQVDQLAYYCLVYKDCKTVEEGIEELIQTYSFFSYPYP